MLTRGQAISECKALWKEIEESGKSKVGFLHSPSGRKWTVKGYSLNCPLCAYTNTDGNCRRCPLIENTGKHCVVLGYEGGTNHRPTPAFLEAVKNLH